MRKYDDVIRLVLLLHFVDHVVGCGDRVVKLKPLLLCRRDCIFSGRVSRQTDHRYRLNRLAILAAKFVEHVPFIGIPSSAGVIRVGAQDREANVL